MLCASPDCVARARAPATPEAVAGYACIVNSTISPTNQWQFTVDGKRRLIGVRPRIRVNCARPVRNRTVYAVYARSRHIAGKVRALVDHLVDQFSPGRPALAEAEEIARGSSRVGDRPTSAADRSLAAHSA